MVPCFGLGEEFFASLTEADAEMARQLAAGDLGQGLLAQVHKPHRGHLLQHAAAQQPADDSLR